jgi:hypothetical protein
VIAAIAADPTLLEALREAGAPARGRSGSSSTSTPR